MDNTTIKSKISCRKCGGPHLTIKCGKSKSNNLDNKPKKHTPKKYTPKKHTPKKHTPKKHTPKKHTSKSTYRYNRRDFDDDIKKIKVKINNLPEDINVGELNTLLRPWGKIGRITIKKVYKGCYSIIDFYNKDEAEYFVEALNDTGFDHRIINVSILV